MLLEKTCVRCDKETKTTTRGLCASCYDEMRRKGRLNEFVSRNKKNLEKKTCKSCKRLSFLYAKQLCEHCYRKETTVKRIIFGSRLQITVPLGARLEVAKLVKQEENKIYEDILKNPKRLKRLLNEVEKSNQ